MAEAKKNMVKWYGWVPDLPNWRDMRVSHPPRNLANLPRSVDLRSKMPPIVDQGELGSCVGCALAAAMQFNQLKQKPQWNYCPSRLFIYYNARGIQGTTSEDSGCQIRDAIKTVASFGVCREDLCPYDIDKFQIKPSVKAYKNAQTHRAINYYRLSQDLPTLKTALANGRPFVFGFSVYEAFEGNEIFKTGVLNMPTAKEEMLGGHAVVCCGYNDEEQRFLIRNSWGDDWGQKGYFTMPYEYLTTNDLADDFWVISSVST
jgi:C1A family cysteine protease